MQLYLVTEVNIRAGIPNPSVVARFYLDGAYVGAKTIARKKKNTYAYLRLPIDVSRGTHKAKSEVRLANKYGNVVINSKERKFFVKRKGDEIILRMEDETN